MGSRRNFIKKVAAAGIMSSMPTVLYSQKESDRSIHLLVRGDDMGKNYGRTMGFMKSFKEGILTSASIMATSAYFEESVRFCKKNPALATGVHLTIADGTQRPVLSPEEVSSLVTTKGFFYESHEEIPDPKPEEMEKEISAQVNKARASGLHFVYLDWHRAVPEIAKDIIFKICQEKRLIYGQVKDGSVYGYTRIGLISGEKFPSQILPDGQKVYYGAPALTQEEKQLFFDALDNLKPGKWLTVCHPGLADANRASTTELMCSPTTKEIIKKKNIQLVSYQDLWDRNKNHPSKR